MERVTVDDVDPTAFRDGVVRRGLSDPLGTTDVAINRYRITPGEGLPAGLHAHVDQEEVFVVLDGEATFETLPPRDGAGDEESEYGEVVVGAGEAIRFAPGEFQSGRNDADEELIVLALGAPRDSEDVRLPVACPDCGHGDLRLATGGEALTFACPACDAEHVPAPCPACGGEDLQVTLDGEGGTEVVCQDCRAVFADPPLRD